MANFQTRPLWTLTLVLVSAVSGCMRARTPAPAAPVEAPAPDRIPPHDSFTVQSAALGEPRPVNVYLPPQYRGASAVTRFPVLYMPDGGIDEDFPHVVNTIDSLIALRRIRPVIVVGVPNTQRRRDLTGATRVKSDSAIARRVGGSAAFRRFLRDELVPEVARRYRVTSERGIVGESLAGLFVVETFLREPSLFTHYVAFDPSVWWNAGALVDSAATALAGYDGSVPRTLYLATSKEPGTAVGSAQLDATLRRLAPGRLRWVYLPRTDLRHDNIFRTLAPAALAEALR